MVKTYNDSPIKNINRRQLRKIAQKIWNEFNFSKCDVSISFVSLKTIMDLNKRYFGKSMPTDVICFNLGKGPDKSQIGDIYICPEVANQNSLDYHCTFEDELARLVIHGMLHFIGFDDKTDTQKSEMKSLEDKYLKQYFPASRN